MRPGPPALAVAGIPDQARSARISFPLKSHPLSSIALPALAALLLASLLGACEATAIYQPVDSDSMAGRSVVMLKPTHVPPIDEALHRRIIDDVEARLKEYPHLGRLISRREVARMAAADRKLGREYDLYSDTLTVVGVSDREGSAQLGKTLDVEMLVAVQVFYMPCADCETGSQIGLAANLVDAESGKLLWRGHFTASVSDEDSQTRVVAAEELVDDFLEFFDEDVRPKWHRTRFQNLARLGAG